MRDKFPHLAEESEQVDLKKLLAGAWHYWYLFVLGLALSVGAALLYLRYTTPQYEVSSKLLIKDDKKGSELRGDAVFSELDIFKSSNNIDNEIEVLKSISLMERVLTELSLQTSYYEAGKIKDRELYGPKLPVKVKLHRLDSTVIAPVLVLHLKNADTFLLEEKGEEDTRVTAYRFGQKIQRPYASFTLTKNNPLLLASSAAAEKRIMVEFHHLRALADSYHQKLVVEPVSKTSSALTISLKTAVPEKGTDIINKLIDVYTREGVEDKNFIATSTIHFLDERLEYLINELTVVEKSIEDYKRRMEIADVSSQARQYVDHASENSKQLADWSIQIEVLESIESYLQKQGNEGELVPSTLGIKDPTLLSLIARFNELQLERERMLRTTQPNNPIVQNMVTELANLRTSILENLRNIKSGLVITRDNLAINSARVASKIQSVPSIERHLLEISREQGIKQGLYLYLLQKREESSLALAATESNIRIIDFAKPGQEPVSPNKLVILSLALLAGVGLPFGFVYLKSALDDKVHNRKDIGSLTSTPILGEISHNPTNNALVVAEHSRIPIAELFRLIRINLCFTTEGTGNQVMLVTSSMSGDGKTFFAINLAATFALTGKKVVLLDLDLHNSGMLQDLGMPHQLGVTDFIKSKWVTVEDLVKPILTIPGLYVIGTGTLPSNPSQYTMNPKLGDLIEKLKEDFDHIIIDTAPVGLVSDAFLLASMVDVSLYVIRYNHTYKSQIGIINDIYQERKLKRPMIVLNDAKKQNGYGYGNGYGYPQNYKKQSGNRKRLYG